MNSLALLLFHFLSLGFSLSLLVSLSPAFVFSFFFSLSLFLNLCACFLPVKLFLPLCLCYCSERGSSTVIPVATVEVRFTQQEKRIANAFLNPRIFFITDVITIRISISEVRWSSPEFLIFFFSSVQYNLAGLRLIAMLCMACISAR